MLRPWFAGRLVVLTLIALSLTAAARQTPPDPIQTAIDHLGSLDDAVRMEASRTVRRAAPEAAVPALERAVKDHKDSYVRYRALVLLCGFGDASARATVLGIINDRNDRLRAVAYAWFEHHPDRSALPLLVEALPRESSEFVRPSLVRAIAAQGDAAKGREVLLPFVGKGQDFFRGSVIEALGDYKADYAVAAITDIARLDGPLQNDAIIALGKIGGAGVMTTLGALQPSIPRDRQPSIATALCLLGTDCPAQIAYLKQAVAYGVSAGDQPLLRGAAHGLATLAAAGTPGALTPLFDAGIPARDPARAAIALAVGLAALRKPGAIVETLQGRTDQDSAAELLRDAFDMLEEDFEEERFFVEIRKIFWASAENSPARRVTEALIQKLEF